MTDAEKQYQVFNPGAPQRASITLTFASVDDAAWFEAVLVQIKRDGRLSPLWQGLLNSSLRAVSTLEAFDLGDKEPKALTPDLLKEIRCR